MCYFGIIVDNRKHFFSASASATALLQSIKVLYLIHLDDQPPPQIRWDPCLVGECPVGWRRCGVRLGEIKLIGTNLGLPCIFIRWHILYQVFGVNRRMLRLH